MKKIFLISVLLLSLSGICAQENPAQKKISWLEGTWEGSGFQIDNQSWSVSFTHAEKKFTISYPSLACTGWWKISESSKSRVIFIENITVNNGCDQGDKVVVTRIDDKNIGVAWFVPAMYGDKAIAFAVLYKKAN
jgi:hypothetical protein